MNLKSIVAYFPVTISYRNIFLPHRLQKKQIDSRESLWMFHAGTNSPPGKFDRRTWPRLMYPQKLYSLYKLPVAVNVHRSRRNSKRSYSVEELTEWKSCWGIFPTFFENVEQVEENVPIFLRMMYSPVGFYCEGRGAF